MNSVTFEGIVARVPCSRYRENDYKLLRELLPPGVTMTPVEVLSMRKVPPEDRLWAVLHKSVLGFEDLHMLAVLYAERALRVTRRVGGNVDPRSIKALEVKRQWLAGEASGEELAVARAAAAGAAAEAVEAWAAAGAAAGAAGAVEAWAWKVAAGAAEAAVAAAGEWAAAGEAAEAAVAWGAAGERQWQVNRTKRFLRSVIVRRK